MPFLAKEHAEIPTKDILSWIFDNLSYDWDDPIFTDALNPQSSISARQARTLIRKLAAGFRAIGVQPGDCFCMNGFNNIYYPIFSLGLIALGAVFTGVNPSYTPYELAQTFKTAKVKFVFTQPQLLDNVVKAAQLYGLGKDRILIFNPDGDTAPSGYRQWADLLQHGEQDWIRFDDLETSKATPAMRLFSSGTTGRSSPMAAQKALCSSDVPRFNGSRRNYIELAGGSQGLHRFDLETWFWAHEKYEITNVVVVPPLVVMAINHPLNRKHSLKSVKMAMCGAAPLDKGPQARMQELIGEDAALTQVWGMTETTCVGTRLPYPESDTTGSVGRPLRNIDLKLVDEEGRDISGYDVRGELCIRGPNVVRGYFENPEANRRDWDEEGYFHTGDIAYIDGKTKLWYIVDRKKELIKVRAFQVAPAELEGALLDHPDVVDAAVIGVPDPADNEGFEAPRAYLVRREGGDMPREQEVHRWMKEKLASYKQLTGGIVFVDTIPKTPSGKILKRSLREQAKKEMSSKL